MIDMVITDDGDYVPLEMCTTTNPATSGGKSEVDDILSCSDVCGCNCSECIIQKLFNEYAILTNQEEVL